MNAEKLTVEFHSKYKNHTIIKVTQESGRVTYDIEDENGYADSWAHESLAVARAEINAKIEQQERWK